MSIYDNVDVKETLAPAAARTADANGAGVDTKGYRDGAVVLHADTLDTGDGDETYTLEIEESDDNSNWSDVSALDTTIVDGVNIVDLGELNVTRKRYIRAVLNVGGTTPSILCSAVVLLGDSQDQPVRS